MALIYLKQVINQKKGEIKMNNIEFFNEESGRVKLGDLYYGTVITGVESNPSCTYTKVNKRKLGQGLSLSFPKNHSVLHNLKTGGLRTIHGNSLVIVLEEKLVLKKARHPHEYVKNYPSTGW